MKPLTNIGKDEFLYIDGDDVKAILPDTKKTFGSIVVIAGLSHPVATSLDPEDVVTRLQGGIKK